MNELQSMIDQAKQSAQEIERLKGLVNEMSLIIGTLRGIIFSFQSELNENQYDTLKGIDEQIKLLFYTHKFKVR